MNWQISVQKVITSMVIVVTGPSTFRYIKVDHEFKNMSTVHSQLHTGGRIDDFTTNYTCHAWTRDSGRLVVGTEGGDILLCSANGEFETYLPRSPVGNAIQTVIPYGRGIIFAGEDGQIWPFEGSSNENEPYRP